jgi:hypothetical protein
MKAPINRLRRYKRWLVARSRSVRGDTIVEVLISVAIISLILVGAYGITTRSKNTLQDTAEHQQSSSLIATQVEQIRINKGIPGGCFVNGNASSDTGRTCYFTAAGSNNCASTNVCYHVIITPTTNTADSTDPLVNTNYHVSATWDSLLGEQSSTDVYYRLSVTNPAYVATASPSGGGGGGGAAGVGGGSTDPGSPDIATSCYAVPSAPICAGSGSSSGSGGGGSSSGGSGGGSSSAPKTWHYHYNVLFINNTTAIPDSEIDHCVWKFNDGSASRTDSCHYGDSFRHTFPTPSPEEAAPDQCYDQTAYTVVLTVYRANGTSTSKSYITNVPTCTFG